MICRLAVRSLISLIILAAAGNQLAYSSRSTHSQSDRKVCEPEFPIKGGWLGGDRAYSIPTGADTSVWMFGTTIIGSATQAPESATKINNSVGVSTCDELGNWSISYYWTRRRSESPKPIFQTKESGETYQPMDGFVFGEKLYVFLARVVQGSAATNLSVSGVDLAIIPNYTATPDKWAPSYVTLSTTADYVPGVSATEIGGFAYFYVRLNDPSPGSNFALARIAVKYIEQASKHLEYYSKDHKWRTGFVVGDAERVIRSATPDMSIRYHEDVRQFVAITGPAPGSGAIRISTSEKLTGPWGDWKPAISVPKMNQSTQGFEVKSECHSVLEHLEFYKEESKALSVTYVCALRDTSKLQSERFLFKPTAIRIPLTQSPSGK